MQVVWQVQHVSLKFNKFSINDSTKLYIRYEDCSLIKKIDYQV